MSSWRNEFIASLQVRDRKEKANRGLYRAYTKLADRAAHQNKSPAQEAITAPSLEHGISAKQGLQPPKALATAIMDKIREDLTDAQCRRGELQAHLTIATEEVERLQLKLKLDNKLVNGLLADKQLLTTKLKDRDEELRGKAKLLEDVHDETFSLTLQLNMAEAQSQTLKAENQELVDRWMARMGQEAEAMNIASNFS